MKFVALLLLITSAGLAQSAGRKEISVPVLRDKIQGGWAGQMIGVSYGAPTEFRYKERINEDDHQVDSRARQ